MVAHREVPQRRHLVSGVLQAHLDHQLIDLLRQPQHQLRAARVAKDLHVGHRFVERGQERGPALTEQRQGPVAVPVHGAGGHVMGQCPGREVRDDRHVGGPLAEPLIDDQPHQPELWGDEL